MEQADRILFITWANQDYQITPVELYVNRDKRELKTPTDLVLLCSNHRDPKKSLANLQNRKIERFVHVELTSKLDFDRLGRILSSTSVGLVLGGGGGIRAFSHIGIIQALEEHGITIDHIGGTSIGACVGALYGMGMSPAEMKIIVQEKVFGKNLLNDYTWPRISLTRGRKLTKFIREVYGEKFIEDMPRDFFATATNISTSSLEIIDRGHIWLAIRASASLPVILPPLRTERGYYLDGGLIDNIPEGPMRTRGANFVLAIDAGAESATDSLPQAGDATYDIGMGPSFLDIVKRSLNGAKYPLARITDTAVSTVM